VIVPVKTGLHGGFRFEARAGGNGVLIWSANGDPVLPAHRWVPSCKLALTAANQLAVPGAGGKLPLHDNADSASSALRTAVFYGAATCASAQATFDATLFIHMPITIDTQGSAFFGFIASGTNPAGLTSGLARIGSDGIGSWVAAAVAAGDTGSEKVAMNSAPALSPDGSTLYIAVNTSANSGAVQSGDLLALDSVTLATRAKVPRLDPNGGTRATVSDDITASPTIGPDGDVFFDVLDTRFGTHNARGWLLHFDATLAQSRVPGGFGWDDTALIVPASTVVPYTGALSYRLAVKHKNYDRIGSGQGENRVAVIDPNASQVDPISGLAIMGELLSILGPTFEVGSSGPVKEWCINTMAVDPLTQSILVNSEDGVLYRWSLASNSFTRRIRLTAGLGEAYTPTAIGADGAVDAVNNAVLFSVAK
jgi:hypothetical protein